jgi:hypothetical protein
MNLQSFVSLQVAPIYSAVIAVVAGAIAKERPWILAVAGATAAAASRFFVLVYGKSGPGRLDKPTTNVGRLPQDPLSMHPFAFHPSETIRTATDHHQQLKERDLDYFRYTKRHHAYLKHEIRNIISDLTYFQGILCTSIRT